MSRDQQLFNLSSMTVNGILTNKLDLIAIIRVHGSYYFNVFRRYNSVYEIVIEDFNGDIFFHKDYTVRQSINHLLYISGEEQGTIHTTDEFSFKHNGIPPSRSNRIIDMRWSEIQREWACIDVNFMGILDDYYSYNKYAATSQNTFREMMDEAASRSLPTTDSLTELSNKRTWSEIGCDGDNDDDEDDEDDESDSEPENCMYTLLRNGTKIFKSV